MKSPLMDIQAHTSHAKTPEAETRPDRGDGRVHVLVADDDAVLRELIVSILRGEGYLVSPAAGGKEAIEIVAKGGVDVALIDIKMPDINGIEVLKKAKEMDPHMEAVMITGYAESRLSAEAIKNYTYDFISKPFTDIKQIPRTVRRAAEKRKLAQENARLLGRISRQNRLLHEKLAELRLLHKLNNCVADGEDYDGLSERFLEAFLSVSEAEACSLFLLRTSPPILIVRSERLIEEEALVALKGIALQEAKAKGNPSLQADNVAVHCDFPSGDSPGAESQPASDISDVKKEAVTVRNDVVGILTAFAFGDRTLSHADEQLLRRLAAQVSLVMERVRRPVQTQKCGITDGL